MDICMNEISKQLKIHIERLSLVSIHKNEEVCLKPNEFMIDLNTYEKILNPDKIYENVAIICDSIQDNIIQQYNIKKLTRSDNIFVFNNIITNEQCDYIIKTMETYFENKNYDIEKWEVNTNVNCIYNFGIKELDTLVYNIIGKIINLLYTNYNIKSKEDSGYCYRKIFGPTRIHSDGVMPNSSSKTRNMSVIICLNDNYEGGEFYFPKQDRKIKLNKGNIIAFPPYWTHTHMTYPLLNNTYRYTINTWLYE